MLCINNMMISVKPPCMFAVFKPLSPRSWLIALRVFVLVCVCVCVHMCILQDEMWAKKRTISEWQWCNAAAHRSESGVKIQGRGNWGMRRWIRRGVCDERGRLRKDYFLTNEEGGRSTDWEFWQGKGGEGISPFFPHFHFYNLHCHGFFLSSLFQFLLIAFPGMFHFALYTFICFNVCTYMLRTLCRCLYTGERVHVCVLWWWRENRLVIAALENTRIVRLRSAALWIHSMLMCVTF